MCRKTGGIVNHKFGLLIKCTSNCFCSNILMSFYAIFSSVLYANVYLMYAMV